MNVPFEDEESDSVAPTRPAAMVVTLQPGTAVRIEFAETDGDITVDFDSKGDNSISVYTEWTDSEGRDGEIYREQFGPVGMGDDKAERHTQEQEFFWLRFPSNRNGEPHTDAVINLAEELDNLADEIENMAKVHDFGLEPELVEKIRQIRKYSPNGKR